MQRLVNKTDKTKIILQASLASYAVLWLPLGALIGSFLFVIHQGHQDVWAITLILISLGLFATVCFMRLRITFSSDAITYRSVFRTVQIPLHEIEAIHAVSIGREYPKNQQPRGPGIVFKIEPVPGSKNQELVFTIKPYSRQGLRDLINAAQSCGISVYLNEVTAYLLCK